MYINLDICSFWGCCVPKKPCTWDLCFVHRVSQSVCHFCLCTCRHLVFFILVASHSVPCQCVVVITLFINVHLSTLFELCTTLVLFTACISNLSVYRAMSAFAHSSSAASSLRSLRPCGRASPSTLWSSYRRASNS